MPCCWVNFHKLKSYSLISKPHFFKDEIIRLNSIQMSEFLAVVCLKEDVIQWVTQAYRRTKEKKTLIALRLFTSFLLMIKKVTDYEKLWPICWYDDWSERICSSVNDIECSEKKNCECSQCEPNLRPSSHYSSALPQRALGDSWRAKPFN